MVTIASILFSLIYFSRYFTEGLTHNTRASGIKKLPLTHNKKRADHDCFSDFAIMPELMVCVSLFENKEAKLYGSVIFFLITVIPKGTSLTKF